MAFVIKSELSNLRRDKLAFFAYTFCLLSILAQVSLLLVSWGKLPPEVPLFYSRPWGEQILAAPVFLFFIPAVSLFALVMNSLFVNLVSGDDIFLRRVLLSFCVLVALTTLYSTVKIVSLLI